MLRLWIFGAKRGYRRSSLLEDRLDHLCFSSHHYGAGVVVAVEVGVGFEKVILVVSVRDESHAVLPSVPWFCVFGFREYWARGQREGRLLSSSPNVNLQLRHTSHVLGTTLAMTIMAIPFSKRCDVRMSSECWRWTTILSPKCWLTGMIIELLSVDTL